MNCFAGRIVLFYYLFYSVIGRRKNNMIKNVSGMHINTLNHQLVCQHLQHHQLSSLINVGLRRSYVVKSRFKPSSFTRLRANYVAQAYTSRHCPAFSIGQPVDLLREGDPLGF
jgi:hypothetical protein